MTATTDTAARADALYDALLEEAAARLRDTSVARDIAAQIAGGADLDQLIADARGAGQSLRYFLLDSLARVRDREAENAAEEAYEDMDDDEDAEEEEEEVRCGNCSGVVTDGACEDCGQLATDDDLDWPARDRARS